MPDLGQLYRQLQDARKVAADAEAQHGRISKEAVAARRVVTECDSRYTCELLACAE